MKDAVFSAISGLALGGLALWGADTADASITQSLDSRPSAAPAYWVLAQSEAYIPQAHGFLTRSALPSAPGGSKASGRASGMPQGEPISCTWANSTSTDCYAATQQGRPMAK